MSALKIKPWHEWEVPPMWVWVVGSILLIGISTLVFWKIGESISAGARASVAPVTAPVRRDPNDPDSF